LDPPILSASPALQTDHFLPSKHGSQADLSQFAKIAATAQSLSAWRPNPPHFDQTSRSAVSNSMLLSDPGQLNISQMDLPSVLGSQPYYNPYGKSKIPDFLGVFEKKKKNFSLIFFLLFIKIVFTKFLNLLFLIL